MKTKEEILPKGEDIPLYEGGFRYNMIDRGEALKAMEEYASLRVEEETKKFSEDWVATPKKKIPVQERLDNVSEKITSKSRISELEATNKQLVEALEKLKSDIEIKMSTLLSPERYQGMRIALDMVIETKALSQPNPKE